MKEDKQLPRGAFMVGLDIGTTKISVMIGRKDQYGKLEILGTGRTVSNGVSRGIVSNIDKTVASIVEAIDEAQQKSGLEIKDVFIGIAGQHIKSLQHRGEIVRDNIEIEIAKADIFLADNIITCEPLSYLSMTALMNRALRVFTDSGGLQKEAYWAQKPCITLREETEWIETLKDNANQLVGANTQLILEAVEKSNSAIFQSALYGDGNSAPRCVSAINELFQK